MIFELGNIDWTAIGSILGFLTLIFLLWNSIQNGKSIKEMEKQRTESYKPHVLFRTNSYYLQPYKSEYKWIEYNERSENVFTGITEGKLHFNNVGLGPAIDLVITWEINRDLLINELRNRVSNMIDDDGKLILSGNGRTKTIDIFQHEHFTRNEPFISNDSIDINIPSDLFCFCTAIIKEEATEENNDIIELPPIDMKIAYKDISGNKYEQTAKMLFEARSYKGGAVLKRSNGEENIIANKYHAYCIVYMKTNNVEISMK